MKKLIGKYRSATLTDAELQQSRQKANAMSDEQLGQEIFGDWNEFEPDERQADYDMEARVYDRISARWLHRRQPSSVVWRWFKVAAVIALPILLFTTFYFYRSSHRPAVTGLISVATAVNERASVNLPDGTSIDLNSNSRIEYDLASFNSTSRSVKFSGEGYFNVAKVQSRPFTIDAYGLLVTVHGTSFDLQVYHNREFATLFLLDGVVTLTSKKTAEQIRLRPQEKAVLNHATGRIEVLAIGSNDNPSGWKSHKLFFSNAPLADVLQQLEECFQCKITVDDSIRVDRFTGLVPVADLPGAVSVIEKAFETQLKVIQ